MFDQPDILNIDIDKLSQNDEYYSNIETSKLYVPQFYYNCWYKFELLKWFGKSQDEMFV